MVAKRCDLESYIRLFPKEFRDALEEKLTFKNGLDAVERLKIPHRVWLAFLTPPDKSIAKILEKNFKQVWTLKLEMLDALRHPKKLLGHHNAMHASNACITLAILETLYDLKEQKVLLPQEKYHEWLEIAEDFGLWKLRYALEDEVFKTFDQENFSLFESVVEKQMFIDQHLVLAIRDIVSGALTQAGIKKFSIENRRKNIYGVYKKVALKDKSINDIFDIHGFRILTTTPRECYKSIEVLHRLWRHFPERYKDYIKEPKANGYQSLHTVVRCLEGKLIEFQIRTKEMDAIAASGLANHADYKKRSGKIAPSELS